MAVLTASVNALQCTLGRHSTWMQNDAWKVTICGQMTAIGQHVSR